MKYYTLLINVDFGHNLSSETHMLRASLSLLAGQLMFFALGGVSSVNLAMVLTVVIVVWFWLPRLRLSLCAALLGGLIAALAVAQHMRHHWPSDPQLRDVRVVGTVEGLPVRSGKQLRFFLNDISTSLELSPRRIKLSWYQPEQLPNAGERWQFSARLKSPKGLGNPGSFDTQRHSFVSGIDAVGYVRDPALAKRIAVAPVYSIDRLRQALADQISALSNGQTVPLVLGLALGITGGITDVHWQVLRQTGTIHLLAISGLHIGLIAAFGYCIAGMCWGRSHWLQLRCMRLQFAVPVGFVLAWFYAALAGFSLPTQRALLMLCVVGIGLLLRRTSLASFALCIAAILIVLFDPTAVLSIGFTMSFCAVALLIFLARGRISHAKPSRVTSWIQAWRIQWQLSLFMLPLSAWFFSSGSMISPIANIIAIPVVGLVLVPLCLLTVLLIEVAPAAATYSLQLCETILSWLMQGLQLLSQIPASQVSLPLSSPIIISAALTSAVILLAPKGLRLRRWSLAFLLPVVFYLYQLPRVKQLEVHVLDVGQGLAVAVFTRHHTLLFDTGGRFGDSTMMERVVEPFLVSRGRAKLDTVVISHADEDHSAGLPYILESDSPPKIFSSSINGAEGESCKVGTSWEWDGVWFAFVHPAELDQGSRNDRSCVLLVHHGKNRFLLTGDIEKQAESTLVDRGFDLPITVMTAPHHGSASSSSKKFLEAVRPQHVVVPAGRGNRYGFPDVGVLARYKAIDSQIWLTSEHGAVSFVLDDDIQLEPVRSHWQEVDKIWRMH